MNPNAEWEKKLKVKEVPGRGKGLFAKRNFKRGEPFFRFTGKVVSQEQAFRHDVQIGSQVYLALDEPWRYINHSCDPNCGMASNVDVVAMRPIKAGQELVYDYAMTDLEDWGNDVPMICYCGTKRCRKVWLGYIGLTLQDKLRYHGRIAPWLVRKESRCDYQFFLAMRLRRIAAFTANGIRFLQSPQELKQFVNGVMYNLDRIAKHDIN